MNGFIVVFIIALCSCASIAAAQQKSGGQSVSQTMGPETVCKPDDFCGEFSDPAKPVNVTLGEQFSLFLESNRTTGYLWELSNPVDNTIIRFAGTEYRPPKTGLVGAGGSEEWRFEALGKGKTQISLKYVRPWEKEAPPAKTATFTINVD